MSKLHTKKMWDYTILIGLSLISKLLADFVWVGFGIIGGICFCLICWKIANGKSHLQEWLSKD